ncbi:MAG: hypothetical protein HY725_16085, partial [Candidatus Rokubacteria bacterium]|nr:hypothetical protein [Candidatus Rokubacteria bacterium]
EELYADRLVEQYEVLAYHFSKAEEPTKAVEYLVKAGDKAIGAFALLEAATLYQQALALVGDGSPAQRAEILRRLASVASRSGDLDASLRYAEAALGLSEKIGDKRGALDAHMHLQMLYSGGFWDGAREDNALRHLEAAAALSEADPDTAEKGLVYQRTGHLYLHRGQPATTLVWAQRAIDLFGRIKVPMGTSLGTALTYAGRLDEGITYNEKNWPGVLASSNYLVMVVLGHELSLTLALTRDVRRATEFGERALAEVTKVTKGHPAWESHLRRPLTLAHALSGEILKANEHCEAVEGYEATRLFACFFQDAGAVGFHYLRRGEWARARDYLASRLSAFQDRHNVSAVLGCSFFLGWLNLEEGNHAEAGELLSRSLEICRNGGNVLFELWVLPVLAELSLKMGQPDKAAEQVARGFELLKPDQNWYGLPAPMYLARGMLAAASKRWDEGEKSFAEAVAINRRSQLPWDEARTLFEWGLLHLARGEAADLEAARTKLDGALEIFRRVDAKKDVEKVLAVKNRCG